jgi:hypothetical protein
MQLFNYDGGSWGKKNPAEAEWGEDWADLQSLIYTYILCSFTSDISLLKFSDMLIRMLN